MAPSRRRRSSSGHTPPRPSDQKYPVDRLAQKDHLGDRGNSDQHTQNDRAKEEYPGRLYLPKKFSIHRVYSSVYPALRRVPGLTTRRTNSTESFWPLSRHAQLPAADDVYVQMFDLLAGVLAVVYPDCVTALRHTLPLRHRLRGIHQMF